MMHASFQPHMTIDGLLGVFSSAFAALFATFASVLAVLLVGLSDRRRKVAVLTGLVLRRTQFVLELLRSMHDALDSFPSETLLNGSLLSSVPTELLPRFDEPAFSSAYAPQIAEMFAVATFHLHTLQNRIKHTEVTVADVKGLIISSAWWFTVAKSRLKWRAWVQSSRAYLAMFGAAMTGVLGIAGLISLVLMLQVLLQSASAK